MKVLKIGAVWCAGCLVMKPRWQEIENELPNLQTEYFEYDDHPEIIEQYAVADTQLPVFIFLGDDGQELERLHGEVSKNDLLATIEKYQDQ